MKRFAYLCFGTSVAAICKVTDGTFDLASYMLGSVAKYAALWKGPR